MSDCFDVINYNDIDSSEMLDKKDVMKPEKVKSRWRRSSEMEIGEKSALCSKEVEGDGVSNINEKQTSEMKQATSPISEENLSEIIKIIPKYVELEENMYLFERKRTKRKKEVRRMLCECSLTKEERENGVLGCLDECLNRLLMIECGSRCATGEACSNRRFQKRSYAKVLPFKTDKKGWGLKLLEDVPMGNFVIEYVGEVLSRQDFKQRVKQYAREKSNHYYFMALKTDEIIDATMKGNLSRFMNHSCEPNCETQKWTVNGELRIGFFAKRDLMTGEELTFDYQFQRYGREAQKCHCASDSCSGYIGVSNEISLDVSNKSVNNKRKKGSEEKKREVLEDSILEEEIEKLYENGGLRNKDETLILARLMVRSEDLHSREKLLDIILGTSEVGCLRLFLDYHGLSLLWSWMADLTDLKLKTKILQVLTILPVSNKTMLFESKVYSVVERWASNMLSVEQPGDLQHSNDISEDKNFKTEIKKLKSSDTSDSETDGSVFQTSESIFIAQSYESDKNNLDGNTSENLSQYLEEGSVNSTIASDAEETSFVNGNKISDTSARSDEESRDVVDEDNNTEFSNLAQALLSTWKDLKEVFRIPRREQQRQQFKNCSVPRRQNYICRQCNSSEPSLCKHKLSVVKDRFSKDRNKEFFSYPEKIFDHRTVTDSEGRPRKVLLPTPVPLTKEERRLQFEKEVLENDQRKALLKQQQYVELTNFNGSMESVIYNTNTSYDFGTNGNYCNVNSESHVFITTEGNSLPFDQCYYNTDELQSSRPALLPTPGLANTPLSTGTLSTVENNDTAVYTPNVLYHSYQIPLVGTQLSTIPLQPSNVAAPCQTNHVPPSSSLIDVTNNNSSPVVPTISTVNVETTPVNSAIHSGLYTSIQTSTVVSSHNSFSVSPITPQYIASQDQFTANQNGSYYAQTHCTTHLSEQVLLPSTYSYVDTNGEAAIKTFSIKLPPNWKTATDADGNIYYYHILTRQTQWDPPDFEEILEDVDGDTPTYDEPKDHKQYEIHSHRSHKKHSKKKSTTTAPADTSSNNLIHNEIAKKIKELFRTKMSSFVVQCLNPYHRDDCRVGKITSNDDFKHLARKLTHFVMAKELKHCKNVEDLECNDNVKHKARDFIHKYMSKYGSIYKKEKYDSPYVY